MATWLFLFLSSVSWQETDVLIDGCWQVKEPLTCYVIPNKMIRVWTKEEGALSVNTNTATPQIAGFGYLYRIEPNGRRQVLDIKLGNKVEALEIIVQARDNWLNQFNRQVDKGNIDGAENVLKQSLLDKPNDAHLHSRYAMVELQTGRELSAVKRLEKAINLHEKAKNSNGYINDLTILVYLSLEKNKNYNRTKSLLEKMHKFNNLSARERFYVYYYQGVYQRIAAKYMDAKRNFEQAEKIAINFGFSRELITAAEAKAVLLLELGNYDEADEVYQHLIQKSEIGNCTRAQFINSAAWSRLLQAENERNNHSLLTIIEGYLRKANENNNKKCIAYESLRKNININWALLKILSKDIPAAKNKLSIAKKIKANAHLDSWQQDLTGRIYLLEGDFKNAQYVFNELRRTSLENKDEESIWRATTGLALTHLSINAKDEAIALLKENETRIDNISNNVDIADGRSSFYSERQRNTQLLLQLLLSDNNDKAGLALIRENKNRILSQIFTRLRQQERESSWLQYSKQYTEQRSKDAQSLEDDWMLSQQQWQHKQQIRSAEQSKNIFQLAKSITHSANEKQLDTKKGSDEGELKLFIHYDMVNLVVFAIADAQSTKQVFTSRDLDNKSTQALAFLFESFAEMIKAAKWISLYVSGSLNNLPLHQVPIDGVAMNSLKPVVYRLDLSDTPPNFNLQSDYLLFTGDARNDLPYSKKEVNHLAKAFVGSSVVLTGETVGYLTLKDQLGKAKHLHYSGHGFSQGNTWQSALALNDSSGFSVTDILTLNKVPNSVILSACETASDNVKSTVNDWNLVNAFLIAGSDWVLGSPKPVDDQDSYLFMQNLYQHWKPENNIMEAFNKTQLALKHKETKNTWQHFRLYAK